MRLPKLVSQLFHRRSKSDTVLTFTRTKPPPHTILTLSASTSWPYRNEGETDWIPPSLSGILASISTEPIPLATTMPLPTITLPSIPSADVSIIGSGWSVPWLVPSSSLGAGCSASNCQIGQDTAETPNPEVAALESALQMERNLHDETITENRQLTSHVTELQADLLKLRGELFSALKKSTDTSPSPNNNLLKTLGGENIRLRKFVSLMVSASAHKSILEIAFRRTLEGEDPEEAVVHALREDTGNISGILRTLLEPMIATKSPHDYLAQVQCTLKARRETRDWRKKTRFWKNNARQDGRHLDTVTPSVSALSDVVDQLSPERQDAVNKALGKLRQGTLSLLVEKHSITGPTPSTSSQENVKSLKSSRPPSSMASVPTPLSPLPESIEEVEAVPQVIEPLDSSEATNYSSETPLDISMLGSSNSNSGSASSLRSRRSSMRLSSSNLAPLASVTFRENHSIKSKRSFGSHRNSVSSSRGLTPSGSTSSQDSETSKRSARRRIKILAVSVSDQSIEEIERAATLKPSTEDNSSRHTSTDTANASASGSSSRVTSQASSVASDSVAPILSFNKRQSFSSISTSPPETPIKSSIASPNTLSPQVWTPTKGFRSPSAKTLTPKAHYSLTPKKSPSKLPVLRMTSIPRPSIRRLSLSSISKPVLMDTTNAGATASNRSIIPKRKGSNPPVSSVGKKAVMERNSGGMKAGKGKLVLSPKSTKGGEVGVKESRVGRYGVNAPR
ncbi:hypothetical protein QCA50_013446 [Cerrena zonata]|uniref:Uncharacterized protein n=1 Tax=Cerrena zonata TaxID=2478898 RepID=A0AAW0FRD1_9APHY